MESVAALIVAIIGVAVTSLTTAITVWKCYLKARVPREQTGLPAHDQGMFMPNETTTYCLTKPKMRRKFREFTAANPPALHQPPGTCKVDRLCLRGEPD